MLCGYMDIPILATANTLHGSCRREKVAEMGGLERSPTGKDAGHFSKPSLCAILVA